MTSASPPTLDAAARRFSVRLADGTSYEGPIVDLRGVDADVRLSRSVLSTAITAGCPTPADVPRIHAPVPGLAHAHVSLIAPGTAIERRAALAAAAVDRGVETQYDEEIAATRRALRGSPPAVDAEELRTARRRAARAGAETERLREQVATVRGRVEALRDADDEAALAAAEESLSEATRNLSEAATERVAAEQRLSLLEARARDARDERDARLGLEDRLGNLERAARDARVEAVDPEFRDSRRRFASLIEGSGVGGGDAGSSSSGPDAAEALDSGVPDALAVAHIAPVRTPVVVAAGIVEAIGGPNRTFELLGAPLVVR